MQFIKKAAASTAAEDRKTRETVEAMLAEIERDREPAALACLGADSALSLPVHVLGSWTFQDGFSSWMAARDSLTRRSESKRLCFKPLPMRPSPVGSRQRLRKGRLNPIRRPIAPDGLIAELYAQAVDHATPVIEHGANLVDLENLSVGQARQAK